MAVEAGEPVGALRQQPVTALTRQRCGLAVAGW
jgi:hypothetical protein